MYQVPRRLCQAGRHIAPGIGQGAARPARGDGPHQTLPFGMQIVCVKRVEGKRDQPVAAAGWAIHDHVRNSRNGVSLWSVRQRTLGSSDDPRQFGERSSSASISASKIRWPQAAHLTTGRFSAASETTSS
jgi:hypothetical protein